MPLFRLAERTGRLWFPHPGLYKGVILWDAWELSEPLHLGAVRGRVAQYGETRRVSLLAGFLQVGEVATVTRSEPAKRDRHWMWGQEQRWAKIKRVE